MEEKTNQIKLKTSPKDFFLHLLAILALYFSAISFLVLLFQYINILIPDILDSGSYDIRASYFGKIRWSMSSLIVVFPVYLITTWFLNKGYRANPEKRNLRIRRWLIYFTLFVTAVIIIGDLVSLIYNFLGGELTTRFLLKILVVFFVAASIFTYYFWDLKINKTEQ
ncbi:MAG: DUF5671 domain-containing protein [Patescibacteria group bacterium]